MLALGWLCIVGVEAISFNFVVDDVTPTVSVRVMAYKSPSLDSFKGLALFTPGGDLVYCIDPHKQSRWHLQLCVQLQKWLDLSEPPHFLVPCYTATVDLWRDPHTQEMRYQAEAYPLVLRYQGLLNALFGLDQVIWQAAARQEGICEPWTLDKYRQEFPSLWENHDLVVQSHELSMQAYGMDEGAANAMTQANSFSNSPSPLTAKEWIASAQAPESSSGYVLRLYISGSSGVTEGILQNLHEMLERSLQRPYTLRIVDIHKNPEQAEQDRVTATPTLVRVHPLPVRRLVGDLQNVGQLLQTFGSLDY